jgi:hypothetical protein
MRITIILILIASSSYAQQFKKLRVGIGLGSGYGWQSYNFSRSKALLMYLEPSYRIRENMAIGLRLEVGSENALLFGSSSGYGGTRIASYGVNGQYYFTNGRIRPFAGLGVGFYHPGLTGSSPSGNSSQNEQTKFGFYPRIGLDLSHFSFTMDYNIVSPSQATIHDGPTNTTTQSQLGNGYFSVKIGFGIGGGLKRE